MANLELPASDEPFDFRRQAALYARYRRGYSTGLFDAIERRTGASAGRPALDLACGTGLAGQELARRGWRTAGVDFSAPMLREARNAGISIDLIRGRGEVLPLRSESTALVACGTAFHWIPPAPGLAEITRVLAPGGWVALFWRYAVKGQGHMAMLTETLARFGANLAELPLPLPPFGREIFDGSPLLPEPALALHSTTDFTAEEFHGYVSTVEWIRRLAGEAHEAFLAQLHDEIARRYPAGVREETEEYLLLAKKP